MTELRFLRCQCMYNMITHTDDEIAVHECDGCGRWRVDTADGPIRGRGRAALHTTLGGLDRPALARVTWVRGRDIREYSGLLARLGVRVSEAS